MFNVGDKVVIKDHIQHEYLKNGAIIEPTIEREVSHSKLLKGKTFTVIEQIYQEEMVDEHGNTQIEYQYFTPVGTFSAAQLEIFE